VDLSLYEELERSGGDVVIAVDSTGIRVHKAGGWVEREHGKKKRYVKIHLAMDVETKQALASYRRNTRLKSLPITLEEG
jgi:hypothetical protein